MLVGVIFALTQREMKRICNAFPKWATFLPVDSVSGKQFQDTIERMRRAIRILLRINERNKEELIYAELDRDNYREVLQMLARHSEIVASQLPRLMSSMRKMLE